MEELITQIGVPGIIVILILREVIPVIKNGRSKPSEISRAEFEKHKTIVRYRDTCEEIHKRTDQQFASLHEDLQEIKQLVRNNGKPPRVST